MFNNVSHTSPMTCSKIGIYEFQTYYRETLFSFFLLIECIVMTVENQNIKQNILIGYKCYENYIPVRLVRISFVGIFVHILIQYKHVESGKPVPLSSGNPVETRSHQRSTY